MSDWENTENQEIILVELGDECYKVGHFGVTKIEQTVKSGEYSYIPYVRVWRGDEVLAEIPQHKTTCVIFKTIKYYA